jgi:hypothetical protein
MGMALIGATVTHNALTAPSPTGSFDLNGNVTFVLDVTFPARAVF